MDNPPTRRASSPDAPELSPAHANLDDVDEYDPERDGALLKAGEVLKLLNLRSRTSLPEWRDRGDLIGFRMRSGHYRYPANQPALNEARALQRLTAGPQLAARLRAADRRRTRAGDR